MTCDRDKNCSDMGHRLFLSSTCDIGENIKATKTGDIVILRNRHATLGAPH